MQIIGTYSQVAKITAKYNGYDVEVLDVTPDGSRCYVHTQNDAQVLGTPGMWGGCESPYGWVPRHSLTEIRALDDNSNVMDIEPNQSAEERADFAGMMIADAVPFQLEEVQ